MTFSAKNQLVRPFSLPFEKPAGDFPGVEIAASDLGLALQHLDRYGSSNWDKNYKFNFRFKSTATSTPIAI